MTKPMPVSDSAVIDYMERVLELDIAALRRHVGREAARALDRQGEMLPAPSGLNLDGWVFAVRNGAVTAVFARHKPDLRTGRQRPERDDDVDAA